LTFEQLATLWAKATLGPWTVAASWDDSKRPCVAEVHGLYILAPAGVTPAAAEDDARLLAAMREAGPSLGRVVRAACKSYGTEPGSIGAAQLHHELVRLGLRR